MYELPVQGNLLVWQVGEQPTRGTGKLAEPTWFCCSKQSSLPCVCVCVSVYGGGDGLQAECA